MFRLTLAKSSAGDVIARGKRPNSSTQAVAEQNISVNMLPKCVCRAQCFILTNLIEADVFFKSDVLQLAHCQYACIITLTFVYFVYYFV